MKVPNARKVPILKCALEQGTDDIRTDIFYYTMPEEVIEQFSEEQRKTWFALADLIQDSESCAGLGNHAILIAEKKM